MIYPIYLYGSPVLREMCQDIDFSSYDGLDKLIDDMFETMENADGVGLAAPQIGRAIRLFCIDLTPYEEDFPAGTPLRMTFINAHIYERGGDEVSSGEGCLSLPGLNEDVVRPDRIKIRFIDRDGVEQDREYDGFMARVIQHEYDHIDGMMFVDRVAPIRKTLIKSKLTALAKGIYRASYRCKSGK